MKIITNTKNGENHYKFICKELQRSNQARWAVAFLKSSGLRLLIREIDIFLNKGGKLTIVISQNFALTEPDALYTLFERTKMNANIKLYLARADRDSEIFHPKIYSFSFNDNCSIISGSANITNGGLVKNNEVSILADCTSTSDIWTNINSYFTTLTKPEFSVEVTLLSIKQYETYYEQQKKHNKKAKSKPRKTKKQIDFDYTNLSRHFNKYNNEGRLQNLKSKIRNYTKAKQVLDKIANSQRLTQAQFEPLLDNLVGSKASDQLWHSGSLFRLRRSVYPYYKEFRKLVLYISRNKNKPSSTVFRKAKDIVKNIEGASVNYITEIMMTYNHVDFANLNKNPITVLRKEGGVNIKASSSSFSEIDYEDYCNLLKEISSKLELRNMLEVDSFFNDIYWEIK